MSALESTLQDDTIDLMSIGKLIRSARKARNWTLQKLSDETNLNINTLSKYERAGEPGGAFPPIDKLANIALTLGIDPREIFAGALGDGADTDAFFEIDSGTEHFAEASALLEEASKLLRRHGVSSDLSQEEFIDAESFADSPDEGSVPGDAEFYAVFFTVVKKGIDARALPYVVKEAAQKYNSLEYDELFALAQSLEVFHWSVPEPSIVNDLGKSEREEACQSIAAKLLVAALYHEFFWGLTLKGLNLVAEDLNELIAQRDDAFFSFDSQVPTEGMFEYKVDAIERLRNELPPHLVEFSQSGEALNLFDADRYDMELDPEFEEAFVVDVQDVDDEGQDGSNDQDDSEPLT